MFHKGSGGDQMIDVNVDCRLNDSDIISLGTEKLKFEEL